LAEFLIVHSLTYLPCPGGDGGTCSPDTETCPKKNAAHDPGIEPASNASQPTP